MSSLIALFKRASLLLLAAYFFGTAFISLLLLVLTHWDGPWRDMWEVMPFMQSAYLGQLDMAGLWEHYGNSHRFYIAKLLWLGDWIFAGGSNHFLLAVSLGCQLVIGWFVYKQCKSYLTNHCTRILTLSLIVFYLLNPSQLFNLFHTFDVQWFVVTTAATLTCFILASDQSSRYRSILLVFLFGVIASGNSFSGFVLLPVAGLLMLLWGASKRILLFYTLLVGMFAGIYFMGLPASDENVFGLIAANSEASFADYALGAFAVFVWFPLTYFASPLAFLLKSQALHWQVLPQVFIAILLLALIVKAYRARGQLTAAQRFAIGLILFCMAVATATALGRAMFWETVYAERFQNIVLLFWLGVLVLLLSWWRTKGLIFACLCALLFHATSANYWLDQALVNASRTETAHAALRVGLANHINVIQATVSRFHLTQDTTYNLQQETAFLAEHNLAMFANSNWDAPSEQIRSTAKDCAHNLRLAEDGLVQRRNALYWRVRDDLIQPTTWFVYQGNELRALLLPQRSDYVRQWLGQLLHGFNYYDGFSKLIDTHAQKLSFYARVDKQWCKTGLVTAD